VKENKERIKSQLQVKDTLAHVSSFSGNNKKKNEEKNQHNLCAI
jgi:hypothetical protein